MKILIVCFLSILLTKCSFQNPKTINENNVSDKIKLMHYVSLDTALAKPFNVEGIIINGVDSIPDKLFYYR